MFFFDSILDNVTYHEPPRRVLVELQESKVTLSDYLFPGEGAQEALMSLQELLDLRVLESNVQKDLEFQVGELILYNILYRCFLLIFLI